MQCKPYLDWRAAEERDTFLPSCRGGEGGRATLGGVYRQNLWGDYPSSAATSGTFGSETPSGRTSKGVEGVSWISVA